MRVSSADLENGLLIIELVREVPDALKPLKIAINAGKLNSDGKLITAKSGKSKKAA